MTREQAEQIARHAVNRNPRLAGFIPSKWVIDAIMEAAAVEREACAETCLERHANGRFKHDTRDECADAIRAMVGVTINSGQVSDDMAPALEMALAAIKQATGDGRMSQESKTPRTDAEASDAANYAPIAKGWYVHADFARQLERELAAVTEERDALIASARIKEVNAKWDVAKLEFAIKAHESGIAAHSPTTEPDQ